MSKYGSFNCSNSFMHRITTTNGLLATDWKWDKKPMTLARKNWPNFFAMLRENCEDKGDDALKRRTEGHGTQRTQAFHEWTNVNSLGPTSRERTNDLNACQETRAELYKWRLHAMRYCSSVYYVGDVRVNHQRWLEKDLL